MSYATVLFPVVALVVGALLGGEGVRPSFLVGAALVIAGVYVGALAPAPAALPITRPGEASSSAR